MLFLTNSAEGGVDGVTVDITNTGGLSGNIFTNTNTTNATSVFTVTNPLRGKTSIVGATSATAGSYYFGYCSGTDVATLYSRAYLSIAAAPSAPMGLVKYVDGAGTAHKVGVAVNASRLLVGFDVNGTLTTPTGSVAIPTNQTVRLETKVVGGSPSGSVEWKLYLTPSSTGTPDETVTLSPVNTGTSTTGGIWWGHSGWPLSAIANLPATRFDDLVLTDIGYPGPSLDIPRANSFTLNQAVNRSYTY